jgi:hypothetical protein
MNIKTKKLLIPYLKKEYDVEYVEITEKNDMGEAETKEVLLHSTYKRLINDECIGVTYHYAYISLGEIGHYAATCAISDSNGRRVEGVGETNPASLATEIARKYPVQMAHKRAFDDAAMVFLGLYGNYSDSQIIPTSSNAPTSTASSASAKQEKPTKKSGATEKSEAAKPASAPAAAPNAGFQNSDSVAEPIDFAADESDDAEIVVGTLDEEPPVDASDEVSEPVVESSHDPRFDTIITFGRRKSEGLTVAQLAEKDLDSLKWVSQYANVSGDRLVQREAALAWLAAHPEALKGGESVA